MNKRIKKKKYRLHATAKERKRNKELCKRFPFLIPRCVWSDKVAWARDKNYIARYGHKDYDKAKKYDYTLAEEFSRGWWKAFGIELCEELREDLIKCGYLYNFRFVQIKEKYGGLRAYCGPIPIESNAHEIIDKYEFLSNYICEQCGKIDTHQIVERGWVMTICKDCYNKMMKRIVRFYKDKSYVPYEELPGYDDDPTMPNERKVRTYSKDDGEKEITYDISDTVNKIRAKWRGSKNDSDAMSKMHKDD